MGLMTDRKTMAMQGYFLSAWWITKEKDKTSNTHQSKITDNLARGDETIGLPKSRQVFHGHLTCHYSDLQQPPNRPNSNSCGYLSML